MVSSYSRNSEHPWRSHFSTEFSWQYNFARSTAFLMVFHFSAHCQRGALSQHYLKLLNSYHCHWWPKMKKAFLCSAWQDLFWSDPACSSLLQVVLSGQFYLLQGVILLFISDNVKEYFDLQIYYKSTSGRFYYKGQQVLL